MAHEELLARLDYDAACGPNDGLPSILDSVARDCKDAASALRSTLAELGAERNRRLLAEKAMSKTAAYKFEQDLNAERKAWEEERRLTERTYELILQRAEAAERKLAEVEKDAKLWRYVRPWLHIDSNGDLCIARNSFYIGPRDGEAKTGAKMESAILAAIADDVAFNAALVQKGEKS